MARPAFKTYKDDAGKWRWILKARNGETIASSSQGYEKQVDCLRRIEALGFLVPLATTSFTEEALKRDVLGYSNQVFFSHSSKDEELISLIKLAFQFTPVKPYFARSEKAGKNPADKIVKRGHTAFFQRQAVADSCAVSTQPNQHGGAQKKYKKYKKIRLYPNQRRILEDCCQHSMSIFVD